MPTRRPQPARILVVESTSTAALPILRTLRGAGHSVRHVPNGAMALQRLAAEPFDLVLAEWTRPEADALELVRRMQDQPAPPPAVILTAIDDPAARELLFDAGATAFVPRPWQAADLLAAVHDCLERAREPVDEPLPPLALPALAPFHCVCIAASTGGPDAVRTLLRALPATAAAAFVVVVHGPAWMQVSFAAALARVAAMPVRLAAPDLPVEPGHIYLAPGDRHTIVDAARRLQLLDDAPIHHVRPAADPLFQSVAALFGRRSIAVVLTGLGQDGTIGASLVFAAGGRVLVQDPAHCVAPPMPRSVLAAGVPCTVLPLDEVAPALVLLLREHAAAAATR
ncbi:MAG: response regulator [Planctomycetes bacterium]|nr:response regulator [Planctomycetota bacterium]